ncbi:branched-chain amino acid transport system ATP-binding protein [Variovorax sp. HW608]|uniref:ABC transporter ATP-binding protein n=1 Tax=Variovorax sp. HW608 TaxID=1034889 RepID=UPI00081FB325|nr:ABC transporter ATP-binding protein [Variovorax sp. HW608]SCK10513.1 branched-chain amino acid transport system ATP-binding protein [Variovorax sp. HW608]
MTGPIAAPGSIHRTTPLLSVRDLSLRFGGIHALREVCFDVPTGSICGLIGPNGAGKTSLFNCLSRLYEPSSGEIEFRGERITSVAPHRVAQLGIGRTFQNLALFRSLSVLDNIRIGRHCRSRGGFVANALRLPFVRDERAQTQRQAHALIEFLQLESVVNERVSDLPFGTQKRVELGRALAGEPTLLLLDEPACGLNHEEVGRLGELIRHVRDTLKITVLLVEHHMGLVMSISDHLIALNFGRVLAQGAPQTVAGDPAVVAAYLGGEAA